jgi:hypothetical protein
MRADIRHDLPRVRTAPMMWAFPLFFVLHAAAPGGVLFGLSLGGVIPPPWSYAGITLGLPLAFGGAGLLIVLALRTRARVEHMREAARGPTAHATVVAVEQGLGTFRSKRHGEASFRANKMVLTLALQPRGGPGYQVTQELYFGTDELGALRRGAQLQVHVHPRDPNTVFVPFQPRVGPPRQPPRQGPSMRIQG